ncbi:MAG: lpxL [Hydrocarboniphaga sp.]|uniref:LpxL/LpxP family Kdo(2)-lipid IV(A) lauroyl/palmitoleoyl acyltransferase n=1 Tax=Hydrocarboniphaga sp. TaxID=2033016 RepID=UPI0026074A23|nr:LpxL/LpxP family Kdo(2)-lipid IV(A) lauroyl/palmitoleoyl acyltransferase [Hydrocarboniphaga sp.]MDB5968870.1 lpxL [Hydrocarboniphaga sp.]
MSSIPYSAAPRFKAQLLAPWHWPTWLAIALLWLLAMLPIDFGLKFGEGLGALLGRVVRGRRKVVDVNLRLCFPQMPQTERDRVRDQHFRALGAGVIEAGLAWFASDRRLAPRFSIEGREHLQAALASGKGLLLLTGHFSTLEIGARVLCTDAELPFHAMYRPYANPVMDWCMHRWREKRAKLPALPREDLRRLVRALREGRAIWYAPDQTLDERLSVFAPFFGVPTLTLTATARLAQMGRAGVLPYFPRREHGRWVLRFEAMLDGFPGGDDLADAARINAVIENGVRLALPQYFWLHRRFKKRPAGMPRPY